mgnify:CR=1 FL=1
MAALFSEDWMVDFGNAWNDEPELGDALAKIAFNSIIGYGFEGEDKPRGVLVVENGYVTKAAAYGGETPAGSAVPACLVSRLRRRGQMEKAFHLVIQARSAGTRVAPRVSSG